MKKGKIILIVILLAAIIIPGLLVIGRMTGLFFNNGGRYDDSVLDSMGVVYEDRNDNYGFNEGYSETTDCPWEFIHNGIDYFLNNDSVVIAASPGQVESFELRDEGEDAENRYHVRINIRFSRSIVLAYNFEPWTTKIEDRNHLQSLFTVEVGDWVEKGDQIGVFLNIDEGAHIHFDVLENDDRKCPQEYFGDSDYTELMEMIHSYHPDWDLCYV